MTTVKPVKPKDQLAEYKLRISVKEKMQLMGNLSTMLRAGIPILEVVVSLLDEAKGNLKKVLETVKEDLQAGMMLHQSFARFPNSFDKVSINLIKAAEEAGTLEVALKDAQGSLQREMEFSDKIKSAMIYPLFIVMIFLGVIIMMLVVVMPKIAQVFGRLDMKLSLMTRTMISASNLLMHHTVAVIAVTATVIFLIVLFFKLNRRFVTNLLFSLPVLSGLIRQIDLTKFSRNMALLLNSGLPIVTCLELSSEVVLKHDLQLLLKNAHQNITAGKRFSECLRSEKKLVPGMVIKLIEVGEKTGTLQQSMKDITEMLDYEVSKSLKNATAMLEPIMLVFVGVGVGGMMMAIIGPIYGMISNVNMR